MLLRVGNERKRRVRRFRRSVRRARTKFVRRIIGRARLFKLRREVEFVKLVGFSQAVRFITERLRGTRAVKLRVSGVRTPLLCRTSGADRWTLWHVFARQHFETTSQQSPRLIIDGGANVGYASVYFANKHPDTQITAIEPDPENCALFRKNCAAYPNIELIQGALWSSSADLIIENPTARSHAFRVVEVPSPTKHSIKGFTVADILAHSGQQHIDLLKLDIEGSEERLFSSGCSNWIGHVKKMMVEPHGERCREAVSAAAKDCGFSVSKSGEYMVLETRASQGSPEQEEIVGGSGQLASGSIEDGPEPPNEKTVVTEERIVKEEQLLRRSIEHIHGPEKIPYEEDELVVVCIVRDGRPYVKSFVDHYFSLGVKHIAFLDNNSTDGTVEALKNYDGVTVLRTGLPYKAVGIPVGNGWTREVLFKQYLVSRFGGRNRWCLCADIDELFDYPYSDVVGLDSLLRYLNGKSYTAVAAQMLDMFSEAPLSGQAGNPDEPLKALHRFYDVSEMKRNSLIERPTLRDNTWDSDEIEGFSGGIRKSVFGHRAFLTKFPLVFNDGKVRPVDGGSHRVGNARIADFTGVLFHYKFLNEHFHAQVDQAVREGHRKENSGVYKIYKETLDREPILRVKRGTAREMKSVNELVENQVLVISDDYANWVDAEEEKSVLQAAPQSEPRKLAEALLDSRKQERAKTLKIQRLERQLRERPIGLESEHRSLKQRANRLRKRNRALKRQLRDAHSSRSSSRILDRMNRLMRKILRIRNA